MRKVQGAMPKGAEIHFEKFLFRQSPVGRPQIHHRLPAAVIE
jgi:hypothetical protein